MVFRNRRPTIGVTVRLGLETRELLDQVAKARKLGIAATLEQLVIEESQRLGPPKKRTVRDA